MIAVDIVLFCCIILLILYIIFYKKKTAKQIDFLIDYLMKVQDRNTIPEIEEQAEGKLKILQSEIYKLSAMLHEQYSRETEKNKYLVDMLSNISHQIKTPLTAITIMTDLLKNGNLSESERRKCIFRINGQTDIITWLIRTLLTLAQLDAGVMTLKQENINTKSLIDDIFDSLAIMADVRGVNLKRQVPDNINIICDEHWTKEALSNIIKNCLEHTNEGGNVTVDVSQSNLATEIIISDNGNGISSNNLTHIFERFYRGENADINSIGIGLALSKQIILNQNGMINVSSKEGVGTKFFIKFYHTATV